MHDQQGFDFEACTVPPEPLTWTGVPASVADANRRAYMAWYSEDARNERASRGELDSAGNWIGAQLEALEAGAISPRRALGLSTPDEACTVPQERPRLTTRERRERRAERLRGWADGQEAKGSARLAQARQAADVIPFGQPILVGHYSEGRDRRYRDRIVTNTGKGFEALAKAESMRSRAANIDAAAARSIYSDDDDAIERLEERIATLEAERDRIKRYNASCRKGAPDRSILTEQEASSLDSTMRVAAWQCKGGAFPAYHLSNLSGNIKRQRDRLAQLRRQVSS